MTSQNTPTQTGITGSTAITAGGRSLNHAEGIVASTAIPAMFRTTLLALATTAVFAASGGVAQADIDDFDAAQASTAELVTSVKQQLQGRAFGWQIAIAQDGKIVSDQAGTAISAADTGGQPVAMQPTMEMELASATKTVTAVATMKLLRANGLSLDSIVEPYLPASWKRGEGFTKKHSAKTSVNFRHLLAHTSGLNQVMAGLSDDVRPKNNGWDDMRFLVATGTTVNSPRMYKNANYALLRIINAELWKRSGGAMTYEVSYNDRPPKQPGQIATGGGSTATVPVTKASHTVYMLNYMRKHIFEPAGLKDVGCTPEGPATAVRSYGASATQASKGSVQSSPSDECAGARGLRLSAVEHATLLAHLRHGDIIEDEDLDAMDDENLGWDERAGLGKWSAAFWHGGALLGANQLRTCGATFDDGTEVSLLINSPISGNIGSFANQAPVAKTPCGVVLTAWKAASQP